ncbi:host-nuclease inhibitor Gam family protein [Bacillus thuringiensis]|uniref:host-nuclease inhibitor Gam family protein n=2 Tax=Bacillus thuringiensis TaxID=1428 RepID=UPI0002EA987A|nr:host-nuclease inhibitor Gam family protein [Bacillus thuringiensis]MEB4891177.1 host-nuclease inhibitor Gam family protein [Bacillus thuringiensis]MEC2564724.1 host-nuclease inhibitor Gam family protein [Bacillus thuringiensis]MEC2643602.1 host-nuclease inhibitor Gam family protein [Bacillus thuringiensis]MEC2723213.1 host-nuclease inhibitor Gam family protein [Bacillus thuringiensis]MEC2748632.1 host-nuclease inhibitor Gam family protein [Bacillus thuringiensis]
MNALQQNELLEVDQLQDAEQQFEITDINGLNWAFRKISALKAKEKEITTLANVERDRITQWEQSELKPIHNDISFFETHIRRYHMEQLEMDPKQKTISTPYGKSKTRKSSEALEKADETKLLDYAIENELDDCIKTEIKWGELKKKFKIKKIGDEKVIVDGDGQIVPGVKVKPESISYSVEV